jgi:hypothetical protein
LFVCCCGDAPFALLFALRLPLMISLTTLLSTRFHSDHAMLRINVNITVPEIPCAVVSVDSQDVMGGHTVDVGGNLKKTRVDRVTLIPKLDASGRELTVHGRPPIEQKGEGCNVHGFLSVKRVPGNFHISVRNAIHIF